LSRRVAWKIGHFGLLVLAATAIYARVGDVSRFPTAKKLAAYAGLMPTVRQGEVRPRGLTPIALRPWPQ